MSAGLPFLQKQRKSELTEFAETTKLTGYSSLKKSELEEKLDEHLQKNQTTYSKEPSLSEYYKRLGATQRSPIKKLAEKVSDVIKSDDDAPAPAKKARRKTKSPEDAVDAATALVKTPGQELTRRTSILASNIPLPPSPAVVTDAIDHQTRRIRSSISHAYDRTQIQEYSDAARDLLSSTVTVNLLAIVTELYGLRADLLPNKKLTEIGPIPFVKSTSTPINVPDLFQLLDSAFWAPFSLWLLLTLITPATISYFINLPLKQLPSHSHSTRKQSIRSNPRMQFDPFVFNVTKGLITYLVLGLHFHPLGLYQHATASTVNEALPGRYAGVLISSGIGAAISVYEAVLKK